MKPETQLYALSVSFMVVPRRRGMGISLVVLYKNNTAHSFCIRMGSVLLSDISNNRQFFFLSVNHVNNPYHRKHRKQISYDADYFHNRI